MEDISSCGGLSSVVSNCMGKSLGSLLSLLTVVSLGAGLLLLDETLRWQIGGPSNNYG